MTTVPQWPTKQCYMCLVPNGGHSPHCPNHVDNTALKEKLTEKSRQTTSGPCQDVEPMKEQYLIVEGRLLDQGCWTQKWDDCAGIHIFNVKSWKYNLPPDVHHAWANGETIELVVGQIPAGECRVYRGAVVRGPYSVNGCIEMQIAAQEKNNEL